MFFDAEFCVPYHHYCIRKYVFEDHACYVEHLICWPDGRYWCCGQCAFVSADLFDNLCQLDDGAECAVTCLPLGDGVKLASILLHGKGDWDSVGGAKGGCQWMWYLYINLVEGNVLKCEYFCFLVLWHFYFQVFTWSACKEEECSMISCAIAFWVSIVCARAMRESMLSGIAFC